MKNNKHAQSFKLPMQNVTNNHNPTTNVYFPYQNQLIQILNNLKQIPCKIV
jgi:hypothetical protein